MNQEMAGKDGSLQQHPGGQGSSGALQYDEEQASEGSEKQDAPYSAEENGTRRAWNWKQEILYITLFVSKIFIFMTFALLGPLFPVEAKSKGVSYTVQGWILGAFGFTQV